MAAGTEVNTVWIGFMDMVPVIGTVKEAVELVLALYEGNKEVMTEKEEALEDFVEESLKKHVTPTVWRNCCFKRCRNPDASAPSSRQHPDQTAADASEFSGLKNVKEIRKEKIIEYMSKGSKKGAVPSAAQQEKNKKTLEKVKEDALKMIHIIDPDFIQELKEQLERSKRGEHVFNNNILRFHSDVLTEFIERHSISTRPGYNKQDLMQCGRPRLHSNTVKEIQDNMKVDIDDDEFYVNVNSLLYGFFRQKLFDALLDILGQNRNLSKKKKKKNLNLIIDTMNKYEIYVDQVAKMKWINQGNRNRQTRFEKVRREVAKMYREHRSFAWCYGILRKVDHW